MAGSLLPEDRKTLARTKQLVAAARDIRKALVADLKRAAGLQDDPIAEMLGAAPGKTDDPIRRMAGLDPEVKDKAA